MYKLVALGKQKISEEAEQCFLTRLPQMNAQTAVYGLLGI